MHGYSAVAQSLALEVTQQRSKLAKSCLSGGNVLAAQDLNRIGCMQGSPILPSFTPGKVGDHSEQADIRNRMRELCGALNSVRYLNRCSDPSNTRTLPGIGAILVID